MNETNPFSTGLVQARTDWTNAQASLKAQRDTYLNGASVRLSQITTAQELLSQKIGIAEADKAAAESTFKQAFEAAGFEKTATVQSMLNQRNDAMLVSDELHIAANRLAKEYEPLYLQADQEAQAYQAAHTTAFIAYSRMHALEILEKHGPAILDAMSMMTNVPRTGLELPSPYVDDETKEARRRVVWELLELHAKDIHTPSENLIPVIGALELGPLAGKNLLTPMQRHRRAAEVSQND